MLNVKTKNVVSWPSLYFAKMVMQLITANNNTTSIIETLSFEL